MASELILFSLLLIAAVVWLGVFFLMIFVKPARLDPDTGEPAMVWKAWTITALVLMLSNANGAITAHLEELGSTRSIIVRIIVVFAGVYVFHGLRERLRVLKDTA